MKRFILLLFFIFMVFTVSCRNSKDEQVHFESAIIDTTENIETSAIEETTQEEETIFIIDDDMYIPGVAVPDKSEPKIFEETSLFGKDKNLYPKVDGSTALLPLMAHIRKNVLDEELEDAENATSCTKTNEAWYNLSNGNADVLIVGEMPGEVKSDLRNLILRDSKYHKLKYAPIRREGLVFIVNKNNPVESLTRQQLIDIYTGKITNWKEVGGEDVEIAAFQREEKSGSQTIFRKVLMKDIEPEKREVYYYPGDMDSLIDVLASYDNSNNAIGYSVYYYVTQMYKNDSLKLIKVDGIEPNNETISNITYPLLNESYVAIKIDEKKDSNAHILYDYIRSNKGREAIIEAGYVPVK